MLFWGVEVKPGESYTHPTENVPGVLHVTQATLGDGSAKERSVAKCSIGRESPTFMCALLPGIIESCSLNLGFGVDQLVEFSVSGPRSIHLSGIFVEEKLDPPEEGDDDPFNNDMFPEDMPDSSDFNTSDEYDEDIEEDDFELSSPVRKSGVVIEEKGQSKKQKKKKTQSGSKDSTGSESEDAGGFPISTKKADEKSPNSKTNKKTKASNFKRKVENTGEEGRPKKKKKKNKKLKEQGGNENESNVEKVDEKSLDVIGQTQPEEKKKNKKKKKKKATAEKEKANAKSLKTKTHVNGLVVEELSMGKPGGRRAIHGKYVFVRYTGKLVENGKIFDSNIGKGPFKFRLGMQQAISGLDVGINGMCVGDKRRITIPPAMGYGSKGAGKGEIPGNAWLTFDVELIRSSAK